LSADREARRSSTALVAQRVVAFLSRRRAEGSAKRRRVGFAAALLLFVVGSIIAFARLPDVEQEPRWELLVVVGLIGVPLTLVFNGAEYQVAAAIASYRVSFSDALRVGFMSTAANMLPIPGALLVKAHAIRRLGGSYGGIAVASGVVAVSFVAVTCLLGGGLLLSFGQTFLGSALVAGAVLLFALAFALLRAGRTSEESARLILASTARAAGAVAVKAGRLYLVLIAFGYEAGATQALTLTVAAVIATMLGFFPGGLGAAEALAAAFAPLVGLSAAVGFVASAVDRLITMVGLAVIGAVVFLVDRRRERPETASQ
jgi:uncharacterized membrane protein YbhN (UPF0104 family)